MTFEDWLLVLQNKTPREQCHVVLVGITGRRVTADQESSLLNALAAINILKERL